MAEFHECDATDAAPTKSAPTDSAPPDSVPHDSVPPDSVPSGSVSAGSLSQVPGLLAELDAVVDRLPHDKKVAAEATLAGLACEHTPAEIGELGQRLLDNLDPDGELSDGSDRKRRRNVWVNRQDAQQMSKLTGHLDPETRALIETLWAVWATPGLNNPDDPDSPPARNGWCLSPAPTGTCAQHPTVISPPPTWRCITPCVTSPTAATPTSSTSPPPVARTTGWSAKTRASSPPGSTPTAPTPAACGGDATANPTLEQARARIHPPPAQAPPQRLNSFELTEMIPQPISVMEACLAHRLYTSATGRGAVTDRRAVTPSIDHARGRQSTAAGRPRRDRSRN